MVDVKHLTMPELEAGLDAIRQSPKDDGILELIVRRPQTDERELLDTGELSLTDGLVGDTWKTNGRSGTPNFDTQLTVMNARAAALVALHKDRWPLAGDQLYIDLDLSLENLPPGTRLAIGSAVIEISPVPHTGCKKFVARFGLDAMKFVNSPVGRRLNLRGINARIIQPGTIRVGNAAKKMM